MKRTLTMVVALFCVRSAGAAEITVPFEHPTIQAAINAANDFDVIVVLQGEYFENIDFLGKKIALTGFDPTNPAVVAATIINGGGSGPVVTIGPGSADFAALHGFTIKNGGGVNGAGLSINGSSPSVRWNVFSNNSTHASGVGGAVHIANGGVMGITHCTFEGNWAFDAGAIYADPSTNLSIATCEFRMNNAGSDGGAVFLDDDGFIQNCEFHDNGAGFSGGAVLTSANDVTIRNSNFSGNQASFGAALELIDESTVVRECTFSSNHAVDQGGAIHSFNDDLLVEDCSFTGNSAGQFGGAIRAFFVSTTISGSYFCGNVPDQVTDTFTNGGGNSFEQWCFNFIPGEWLWFDPFEWDDVLTTLDYELLAQVTFEDAAVLPGKPVLFDDPLNVLTDNGVFEPCAIPSFMCIKSNVNEAGIAGEAPRGVDGLMAAGADYMALPAVGVMPTVEDDSLDIVLLAEPMMGGECYPPDPVIPGAAIGIQYCALSFGEPLIVTLFDQDDVLIGNFEVFPKQSETAPCGLIGIAVMNGQLTGTGERVRIGRVNIWSFTHELEAITEVTVYGYEPCVADLSGDGTVDTVDLLMLLGMWGANPGSSADFDGDGVVGVTDLLAMLGAWGGCL